MTDLYSAAMRRHPALRQKAQLQRRQTGEKNRSAPGQGPRVALMHPLGTCLSGSQAIIAEMDIRHGDRCARPTAMTSAR